MAQCTYCGRDTKLYANGIPVCVDCSNELEAGRKPPVREKQPEQKRGTMAGGMWTGKGPVNVKR